jgi:CTP synthase
LRRYRIRKNSIQVIENDFGEREGCLLTKFIFVTGGVVSSLGKGIAAASLGALLQSRGYKVRLRKLDPYLNVDPGTMSPFQHGEVYVTEDGTETDLDLGHYERFTGVSARASDSTTTGKIYSSVLAKERRGDYLGATVQVVPHIIDEIKAFITADLTDEDFVICEIGGTVGDIEGLPFLEAIRQLSNDLGRENTLFIHLTLLPYIATAGELKTKPTQHSVRDLLSFGIQPDILLCRSDRPIPEDAKHKLGLFCNVRPERVIEAKDIDTIYQVPMSYHQEGLDWQVCRYFGLKANNDLDLSKWHTIVDRIRHPDGQINIAVVGKYVSLLDAYKSLSEALIHGGVANNVKVKLHWLDSDNLQNLQDELVGMQGILVPGGFGERGIEGKLKAIQIAREKKIPYLGICLGMQLAVIEAARNLLGLKEASSTEFGPTPAPIIGLMTEWMDGKSLQQRSQEGDLGGTMRLGAYRCKLQEGSLAHKIYGSSSIYERHRHRYEVNTTYSNALESVGLHITGLSPDGQLPEIIERQDHPWFVAVQFHPELKSRPFDPHPLFVSFIAAAIHQERLV